MDKSTVKALKPLNPKEKKPYDSLINEVRVQLGVPLNRSMLSEIALSDYVAKRTNSNGKVDIKALAYPIAKIKAEKEIKSLEKKLAEKKRNIDALK